MMLVAPRRDRGLERSLGAPLSRQIKQSRILLVGAGGIGCEVLKNLVCCGFGSAPTPQQQEQIVVPVSQQQQENAAPNAQHLTTEQPLERRVPGITIIDLDTIDLSNLNRQFLFRKRHIKQPKAFVAKETASQYNPAVNIDARHASIFDEEFNAEFFESFDLVFNALDNVPARRHVNRMCLAADVPLIESGTTGYNGQVQAIKKGITECYDCNEKPVQKSYPICTIRSTPSQPIHCIVWAKSYLLPELFGQSEESIDMQETAEDNAEEVANLKEEAQALKRIRSMMGDQSFAKAVYEKVFEHDVHRLLSMADMWKNREKPKPIKFDQNMWTTDPVKRGRSIAREQQRDWTMEENTAVFCASLDALTNRVENGEATIEFDKDDKDTLDFVTAAANLRAHVFGIPAQTEWRVKQMAGNIIPAIATSNAMTASLCVMQAFKILRSKLQQPMNGHAKNRATGPLGGTKMTFLTSKNTERMIATENLQPPNKSCAVCSPAYAKIRLPPGETTLQKLVDQIRQCTGLDEFSITTEQGGIYDPDELDNLDKPLSQFGVVSNTNKFIIIADDDSKKVDLVLSMAPGEELAMEPSTIELPEKPQDESARTAETSLASTTDTVKRKREDEEASLDGNKRVRMDEDSTSVEKAKLTNGATVIDVDEDGAILLD